MKSIKVRIELAWRNLNRRKRKRRNPKRVVSKLRTPRKRNLLLAVRTWI